MPLISEPPDTIKRRMIRQLQQLPDNLIEKLYSLDVMNLKGKMQYDLWLSDKYKECREASYDKKWLRFEVGEWVVYMESEDYQGIF